MDALNIPPRFLNVFTSIRKVSPKALGDVISHLQNLQQFPLNAADFAENFVSVLGNKAQEVAEQLLALNRLRRDKAWTAASLVTQVTNGLKDMPAERRWTEAEMQEWSALEEPLVAIFSTEALDIASKAAELAYEHTNLLSDAMVVTDIRPIYDETGEKIRAALISQTLRVYFTSEDGDHSVSIALDQDDLIRLRDSCSKAIKKAEAAYKLLRDAKVPASITGDNRVN